MSFIDCCIKTAFLCIAIFAALSAVLMLSIAWVHYPRGILRELRRKRERNRKNEQDS